MVLILITYYKIRKPDKAFKFAQLVQEKQTRSVFKSWLANSSSELPEGSMITLKKVVLIGLRIYLHVLIILKRGKISFSHIPICIR